MNKRLRSLRIESRLSQKEIADLLGISQSAYSQIEKGTVAVSVEHLKTLCHKYDVSMDWLALGKGPKKSVGEGGGYIPLVSVSAVAGYLKNLENPEEYLRELETYKIPGFGEGEYRIFEVSGNSMKPNILQHDYLICSAVNKMKDVLDGSICVVVEADKVAVKRVSFPEGAEGPLTLQSDNPRYQAYQVERGELRELWLVNAKLTNAFMAQSSDQESRIKKLEQEFSEVKDHLSRLLRTF